MSNDVDDLDDWGDGDDFGFDDFDGEEGVSFEGATPSKGPVKDAVHSFVSGAKKAGMDSGKMKLILEKTLPSRITDQAGLAGEASGAFSEFIGDNLNSAKKDIRTIAGFARSKVKGDSFLGKKLDGLIGGIEVDDDDYREDPEAFMNKEKVQDLLSDIFDKEDKKPSSKEKAYLLNKIATEKGYKEGVIETLSDIRQTSKSQFSFSRNITLRYQRKNLEIGMKSFYVQKEMLRLNKDYYKETFKLMSGIQHNTGLSEIAKTSLAKSKIREKSLGVLDDFIKKGSNSNSILGRGLGRGLGKLKGFSETVLGALGMGSTVAEMGEMQAEMGALGGEAPKSGLSKASGFLGSSALTAALTTILGGVTGDQDEEKEPGRVSKFLKIDKLERKAQKKARKFFTSGLRASDNAGRSIKNWLGKDTEDDFEDGLGKKAAKGTKKAAYDLFFGDVEQNDVFSRGGEHSSNEQILQREKHVSITKIIPGLLTKSLAAQNKMAGIIDSNTEWNWDKGVFTSREDLAGKLTEGVDRSIGIEDISSNIDSVVGSMLEAGAELSSKEIEAMRDTLLESSLTIQKGGVGLPTVDAILSEDNANHLEGDDDTVTSMLSKLRKAITDDDGALEINERLRKVGKTVDPKSLESAVAGMIAGGFRELANEEVSFLSLNDRGDTVRDREKYEEYVRNKVQDSRSKVDLTNAYDRQSVKTKSDSLSEGVSIADMDNNKKALDVVLDRLNETGKGSLSGKALKNLVDKPLFQVIDKLDEEHRSNYVEYMTSAGKEEKALMYQLYKDNGPKALLVYLKRKVDPRVKKKYSEELASKKDASLGDSVEKAKSSRLRVERTTGAEETVESLYSTVLERNESLEKRIEGVCEKLSSIYTSSKRNRMSKVNKLFQKMLNSSDDFSRRAVLVPGLDCFHDKLKDLMVSGEDKVPEGILGHAAEGLARAREAKDSLKVGGIKEEALESAPDKAVHSKTVHETADYLEYKYLQSNKDQAVLIDHVKALLNKAKSPDKAVLVVRESLNMVAEKHPEIRDSFSLKDAVLDKINSSETLQKAKSAIKDELADVHDISDIKRKGGEYAKKVKAHDFKKDAESIKKKGSKLIDDATDYAEGKLSDKNKVKLSEAKAKLTGKADEVTDKAKKVLNEAKKKGSAYTEDAKEYLDSSITDGQRDALRDVKAKVLNKKVREKLSKGNKLASDAVSYVKESSVEELREDSVKAAKDLATKIKDKKITREEFDRLSDKAKAKLSTGAGKLSDELSVSSLLKKGEKLTGRDLGKEVEAAKAKLEKKSSSVKKTASKKAKEARSKILKASGTAQEKMEEVKNRDFSKDLESLSAKGSSYSKKASELINDKLSDEAKAKLENFSKMGFSKELDGLMKSGTEKYQDLKKDAKTTLTDFNFDEKKEALMKDLKEKVNGDSAKLFSVYLKDGKKGLEEAVSVMRQRDPESGKMRAELALGRLGGMIRDYAEDPLKAISEKAEAIGPSKEKLTSVKKSFNDKKGTLTEKLTSTLDRLNTTLSKASSFGPDDADHDGRRDHGFRAMLERRKLKKAEKGTKEVSEKKEKKKNPILGLMGKLLGTVGGVAAGLLSVPGKIIGGLGGIITGGIGSMVGLLTGILGAVGVGSVLSKVARGPLRLLGAGVKGKGKAGLLAAGALGLAGYFFKDKLKEKASSFSIKDKLASTIEELLQSRQKEEGYSELTREEEYDRRSEVSPESLEIGDSTTVAIAKTVGGAYVTDKVVKMTGADKLVSRKLASTRVGKAASRMKVKGKRLSRRPLSRVASRGLKSGASVLAKTVGKRVLGKVLLSAVALLGFTALAAPIAIASLAWLAWDVLSIMSLPTTMSVDDFTRMRLGYYGYAGYDTGLEEQRREGVGESMKFIGGIGKKVSQQRLAARRKLFSQRKDLHKPKGSTNASIGAGASIQAGSDRKNIHVISGMGRVMLLLERAYITRVQASDPEGTILDDFVAILEKEKIAVSQDDARSLAEYYNKRFGPIWLRSNRVAAAVSKDNPEVNAINFQEWAEKQPDPKKLLTEYFSMLRVKASSTGSSESSPIAYTADPLASSTERLMDAEQTLRFVDSLAKRSLLLDQETYATDEAVTSSSEKSYAEKLARELSEVKKKKKKGNGFLDSFASSFSSGMLKDLLGFMGKDMELEDNGKSDYLRTSSRPTVSKGTLNQYLGKGSSGSTGGSTMDQHFRGNPPKVPMQGLHRGMRSTTEVKIPANNWYADGMTYDTKESVEGLIPEVAKMFGFKPSAVRAIVSLEATHSFSRRSQNKNTLASGLTQAIASTWHEWMHKWGKKYGVPNGYIANCSKDKFKSDPHMDGRFNAKVSLVMAMANVHQWLTKHPEWDNIVLMYTIHYLGDGGGPQVNKSIVEFNGLSEEMKKANGNNAKYSAVYYSGKVQSHVVGWNKHYYPRGTKTRVDQYYNIVAGLAVAKSKGTLSMNDLSILEGSVKTPEMTAASVKEDHEEVKGISSTSAKGYSTDSTQIDGEVSANKGVRKEAGVRTSPSTPKKPPNGPVAASEEFDGVTPAKRSVATSVESTDPAVVNALIFKRMLKVSEEQLAVAKKGSIVTMDPVEMIVTHKDEKGKDITEDVAKGKARTAVTVDASIPVRGVSASKREIL